MLNEQVKLNILFIFTAIVGAVSVLSVWMGSEDFLRVASAEDGIIENLSAFFYLCGFIVCLYRIIFHKNRYRVLLYLWAFLCLFFLGEETSWFQRFLDYSTPASMVDVNAQKEFNIHNLDIFQGGSWLDAVSNNKFDIKLFFGSQNLFRLGFFTYFFILPLLMCTKMFQKIKIKIEYEIPSIYYFLSVWITILLSFFLARYSTGITKSSLAETREMFYALFIFLYVYIYTGALVVNKQSTANIR